MEEDRGLFFSFFSFFLLCHFSFFLFFLFLGGKEEEEAGRKGREMRSLWCLLVVSSSACCVSAGTFIAETSSDSMCTGKELFG